MATPEDEEQVVDYLSEEVGLKLLLRELTEHGHPDIAKTPRDVIKTALPSMQEAASVPFRFIFWCEQLGPIRTLGDAPPPADPVETVARLMTVQGTGRWADLVDLSRTPVIRWSRSRWHGPNRLTPASPQAMAAKVRDQPPQLTRLYQKIERTLRKKGRRINPFEHCSELPHGRQANETWAVVWALPHAATWIASGGEVWPWDA